MDPVGKILGRKGLEVLNVSAPSSFETNLLSSIKNVGGSLLEKHKYEDYYGDEMVVLIFKGDYDKSYAKMTRGKVVINRGTGKGVFY